MKEKIVALSKPYIKKFIPQKVKMCLDTFAAKRAFAEGKIKREVPYDLAVSVSNVCSANCVFCAYQFNDNPKEFMSFDIFKKAVDDYADIGGNRVNLTPIAGDPLTDLNLFEKINYTKKLSKINWVFFSTNAVLLNKNENYKRIIDSGIDWLQISTPGLDEDAYRRVFRTNQYPQILQGIKNLADYKFKTGSKIEVILAFRIDRQLKEVMRDPGFKEIESYIQSGLIKIDPEPLIEMDNWGGQIKDENLPGIMCTQKVNIPKPDIPCIRLIYDLSVLPSGLVRLCGCRYIKTEIDDLVIGDLKTQHLKDILDSIKCNKIIEDAFKGNWVEVCKQCMYYGPCWTITGQARME